MSSEHPLPSLVYQKIYSSYCRVCVLIMDVVFTASTTNGIHYNKNTEKLDPSRHSGMCAVCFYASGPNEAFHKVRKHYTINSKTLR